MAGQPLFTRLYARNALEVVEMNEVALLKPGSTKRAIGTRDLNGCSAILVVGKGIILAHIAPYPPEAGTNTSQTGLEHFRDKLKEVIRLVKKNRDLFNGDSVSWSIFARMDDETPLDHHREIATRAFRKHGLPNEPAHYEVHNPRRLDHPAAKGTVVGIIQDDGRCAAYLEDTALEFGNFVPSSSSQPPLSQAGTSTGASSSDVYWYYDNSRQLYHRIENKQWGRSQREPPANERVLANDRWSMWNGSSWTSL